MTEKELQVCDALVTASKLQNDSDFEQYIAIARSLPITNDPEVLKVILDCINNRDAGNIQYELIEAAERFPDDVFVSVVLHCAGRLIQNSGDWGWLVIQTMMNTPSCLRAAILRFKMLDKNIQTEFIAILNKLCLRDARYTDKAKYFK